MRAALRPGGRLSAVVYSTADRNGFFADPGRHHPPPRPAAPARTRAARPVQPRRPRRRRAGPDRGRVPRHHRRGGAVAGADGQRRRVRPRSNASRSARCTRCWPACPSPSGRPPGPRSARRWPSSTGRTGSSARARCSSSPAPGEPDGTVKIAAVQAAYVLMDQKACLDKAVDLLHRGGRRRRGDRGVPGGVHPRHPDLDRQPADLGRRRRLVRAPGRPGGRGARPGHRRARRRRPRRRRLSS